MFRYHPARTITYAGVQQAWFALKKRLGINLQLTLNDLRRTTADAAYEATKDLRIVQHLMGHRSLSSTLRYLERKDPARLSPLLHELFHPRKDGEPVQ